MSVYDIVADIGGTNARFALSRAEGIEFVRTLSTKDHEGLSDALNAYLNEAGHPEIDQVRLAIAGPVEKPVFAMTNNHWIIDKQQTQQAFAKPIRWLNDFEAQAFGVSQVSDEGLLCVKQGTAVALGNRLVVGPGTGLGVAGLVWGGERWVPVISEGGHTGFAASNDFDLALHGYMLSQQAHMTAEDFLSGTGLPKLYQAVASVRGEASFLDTPIAITQAAYPEAPEIKPDAVAQATMQTFFRQLGHAVANAALIMGSTGGVYLTGGLLPKLQKGLMQPDFLEGFGCNQNRQQYLHDMPVMLNLDGNLGLRGSAVAI